jgi:hypothetical protein
MEEEVQLPCQHTQGNWLPSVTTGQTVLRWCVSYEKLGKIDGSYLELTSGKPSRKELKFPVMRNIYVWYCRFFFSPEKTEWFNSRTHILQANWWQFSRKFPHVTQSYTFATQVPASPCMTHSKLLDMLNVRRIFILIQCGQFQWQQSVTTTPKS